MMIIRIIEWHLHLRSRSGEEPTQECLESFMDPSVVFVNCDETLSRTTVHLIDAPSNKDLASLLNSFPTFTTKPLPPEIYCQPPKSTSPPPIPQQRARNHRQKPSNQIINRHPLNHCITTRQYLTPLNPSRSTIIHQLITSTMRIGAYHTQHKYQASFENSPIPIKPYQHSTIFEQPRVHTTLCSTHIPKFAKVKNASNLVEAMMGIVGK